MTKQIICPDNEDILKTVYGIFALNQTLYIAPDEVGFFFGRKSIDIVLLQQLQWVFVWYILLLEQQNTLKKSKLSQQLSDWEL